MQPKPATVRLLWAAILFLSSIGVAVVIRSTLTLAAPSRANRRFPEAVALDGVFARHPRLTMLHTIPGLLFVALGPLQFMRSLRSRRPGLHRWTGRVFAGSGLVIGTTALVMAPQMAIGGVNEAAATMSFACVLLFALVRAYRYIRRRQVALHREWMIRAYAIGLAVATARPVVGAFFATRALTHLTPHEFFGTAFWISFTMHLIAAEAWINYTRPPIAAEREA